VDDISNLTNQIVEFYEKLSSWELSVVREQGMTLPQMHTLEILGTHEPLRMKELAQRMGVTTGTLTIQIDKLERLEMVRRRPHEEDRRSILVELTPKGKALAEEHHTLHEQLTRDITAQLGSEERRALEEAFRRMNCEF
jgi:DNA-binding MarR family transcriptional regulator